jgi:hypothetical protein
MRIVIFSSKASEIWEDLDVDKEIKLKLILQKQDSAMSVGFIRLRIGHCIGLL